MPVIACRQLSADYCRAQEVNYQGSPVGATKQSLARAWYENPTLPHQAKK